jgi:hypothetical protein
LSDVSIRRRKVVRERLIAKDRAAEEDEKKKQLAEEEKKEKERFLYFDISFSLQFQSYLEEKLGKQYRNPGSEKKNGPVLQALVVIYIFIL